MNGGYKRYLYSAILYSLFESILVLLKRDTIISLSYYLWPIEIIWLIVSLYFVYYIIRTRDEPFSLLLPLYYSIMIITSFSYGLVIELEQLFTLKMKIIQISYSVFAIICASYQLARDSHKKARTGKKQKRHKR